ncbi:hypothetical protein AgCh_022366 [Apium graveolens]
METCHRLYTLNSPVADLEELLDWFLTRLAIETCHMFYTLNTPITGLEELLDWDFGLRLDHPNYMDLVVPNDAPSPINFNFLMDLADQAHILGLGQVNTPQAMNHDIEMNSIHQEVNS